MARPWAHVGSLCHPFAYLGPLWGDPGFVFACLRKWCSRRGESSIFMVLAIVLASLRWPFVFQGALLARSIGNVGSLWHPFCPLGPLLENSWAHFVRLRKWCSRRGESLIFIVLDITLDTLLGAFGITLGSFGRSWGVLGVLVDPLGTLLAPFGCSWHLLWLLLALRGPFF